MDLFLPEFADWSCRGHDLNHSWLDKLADLIRSADAVPDLVTEWPDKYPKLLKWLDEATCALSPVQLLEVADFDCWPRDIRDEARNWLHERFMQSNATLSEEITELKGKLKNLDARVRGLISQPQVPIGTGLKTEIADEFDSIVMQLQSSIPRQIRLPSTERDLPLILVIDDILGRSAFKINGEPVLSQAALKQIVEQRRAFCMRFQVLDAQEPENSSSVQDPIAHAYFCPGQRWDEKKGFCNDLKIVEDWLKKASAGGMSTWALIIADVWFGTGKPEGKGWTTAQDRNTQFGLSEVVPWLGEKVDDTPVLVMTSDPAEGIILGAQRSGTEYLHRLSSDHQELLHHLFRSARVSNSQLRHALHLPDNVVAEDRETLEAYFKAWIAAHDADGKTVLIVGETGSGKDYMAHYIHDHSPRSNRPFMSVNCASLSPGTADSELFGAFPGAYTDHPDETKGRFEQANSGTLFLNEFPELPPEVQPKLLEVLDPPKAKDRFIRPKGNPKGSRPATRNIDVRVICGARPELLEKKIGERTDLLARIRQHVIEIPPLRERRGDIIPLAYRYFSHELAAPGLRLDQAARDYLLGLDFPDNIRGLFSVLKEASQGKGKTNIITKLDLSKAWDSIPHSVSRTPSPRMPGSLAEKHLRQERAGGVASVALPSSELGSAVANVMDYIESGLGWEGLTQKQIEELDRVLDGHIPEVVATLVEWALFRTDDTPSLVKYLTGRVLKQRAPADVVKKLLQIDPRVAERVANSKFLCENPRLRRIIESEAEKWARKPYKRQKISD